MIPLLTLLLGILLARLFWRQIVMTAAILLFVILVATFYRVAPFIGIDQSVTVKLLGVAAFALFGCFVAWPFIVTILVEADRRRAHEKVDQDHDRRLP